MVNESTTVVRIRILVDLVKEAIAFYNSKASWILKYNIIMLNLNSEIDEGLKKIKVNLQRDYDYVNMDTSYEEDVCDYIRALERLLEDLENLGKLP